MREAAELAERLIADTIAKQRIVPGTLTLHADRGTSMRSKPMAALLIDLDVARTHSRPHVSDDNPNSESQFRTVKAMVATMPRRRWVPDSSLNGKFEHSCVELPLSNRTGRGLITADELTG